MPRVLISMLLFFSMTSCSVLRENSKYKFANGVYTSDVFGKEVRKVYVVNVEETIRTYALKKEGSKFAIDSSRYTPVSFSADQTDDVFAKQSFQQASFDIDVLTMPFKYRPSTQGFPRQFTAQLNGGLYLGYRADRYVIKYNKDLLGTANRQINHLGLSFGGFVGIGSTAMNPWVTLDRITTEYEGFVWSKGIATIIGANKISVGFALGWDHLVDQNKNVWIYQERPWIGFVFGLQLN